MKAGRCWRRQISISDWSRDDRRTTSTELLSTTEFPQAAWLPQQSETQGKAGEHGDCRFGRQGARPLATYRHLYTLSFTSCYLILVAWCTSSFAPGSPTPNPRQGGCCAAQCGLERVWDPQLDWQVLVSSHRLLTMRGCSLVKEPLVAANIFSLHTPMGHTYLCIYIYTCVCVWFYDILCGCTNGRPMKSSPCMAKSGTNGLFLWG